MQVKDLTDINKIERNRNIVIYGSGVTGKICLDILEENDYKVEYFIDDDICTNEPQYFTKNVVSILKQRKNSILDAGAYHGEIISDLFQLGIPVKKLTLFEVEQKNYCQMLNNVKANMLNYECVTINQGLWNKSGEIYIEGENDVCRISENLTDKKMLVTTIDEFFKNDNIDFIKMDIEGAELQALKGGINTIQRNRPILSICIYHSPEDFVSIPIYLYNILENYSYSILHHTNEYVESILYAIPNELV